MSGGVGEPAEGVGRIGSKPVHEGRILRVSLDEVRFPDGSSGELEMIRHPGAAAVLPVLGDLDEQDPTVVLVRQYRYAAGGYLYEVPAGLRSDPDEPWDACARRELEEETGYRADELHRLTGILTTPGFTDEVIHLYVATGLSVGVAELDADEFMEVVRLPFSRVLEMIRRGEIVDCKSVATILFAARFLLGEKGADGQ